MRMVGEIFKQAREKLGLDLYEVAHTLKIRHEYLKALEEDSFERLPADVYAKGYIRGYARFLGIDPEPVLSAYAEQRMRTNRPGDPVKEANPIPRSANKSSNYPLILLIVSIIVISAAAILVHYQRSVVEESITPGISGYNSNSTSLTDADKKYTLRITATEKTWLRIKPDERRPEEILLKPGDSKEWASKSGFDIKIGNAGGVKAKLNGKDIGRLGERGQVLKIRIPKESS